MLYLKDSPANKNYIYIILYSIFFTQIHTQTIYRSLSHECVDRIIEYGFNLWKEDSHSGEPQCLHVREKSVNLISEHLTSEAQPSIWSVRAVRLLQIVTRLSLMSVKLNVNKGLGH